MTINETEMRLMRGLYHKHRSLRAVGRILGRSQNTIDKYVRNWYKVERKNIVTKANTNERLIGTYIGLWLGDGTQYIDSGYNIKICSNSDDKLLNEFIQYIIQQLFKKKTVVMYCTKGTKSAYIKFKSRFIYDFVRNFVSFKPDNKTHTIRMKEGITTYSREFLEGILLGLILSDGSVHRKSMRFGVVAKELAQNVKDILVRLGWHPKADIEHREDLSQKKFYLVRLHVGETCEALKVLDNCINKLGSPHTFMQIKYRKNGPGEI